MQGCRRATFHRASDVGAAQASNRKAEATANRLPPTVARCARRLRRSLRLPLHGTDIFARLIDQDCHDEAT
eukprot:1083124-Pyramimonas_sp.AAC.2